MSYEKNAEVPKTIKFSYVTDDLFNIVSLRTMYRGKNIKDEKGKSLVDDFAISQDENDIFVNLLETAFYQTARTVLKLTKGVGAWGDPIETGDITADFAAGQFGVDKGA